MHVPVHGADMPHAFLLVLLKVNSVLSTSCSPYAKGVRAKNGEKVKRQKIKKGSAQQWEEVLKLPPATHIRQESL